MNLIRIRVLIVSSIFLSAGIVSSSYGDPVDVLVVAGGGGGGSAGGGGGAGGVVRDTNFDATVDVGITVTVGGGGSGGVSLASGATGGNSVFGTITAYGGGYGSGYPPANGGSGGSGGGSGQGTSYTGGVGSQGSNGGVGFSNNGGGGGGYTGAGSGNNGGAGYDYLGTIYAAGGGGGNGGTAGGASAGAGGSGSGAGGDAAANSGSGGGGGGSGYGAGGNGGSGIVIVRYVGGTRASGGTISSSGGYTYHTFTSSGTFTLYDPPAPVISSSLTASGTAGTPLTYTITATNSPSNYDASNLPTGLSINTATGEITGTPSVSGTINSTISATNAGGTDNETLVWTIGAPTIEVTPSYTSKAIIHGNVGIGTDNPTYELVVNGTIRAKEIIVETGWADFVFEEGYELPSLVDVERHIAEKKRLPGIPSADEVEREGVGLGEMQVMLLQKIEELTLHQIAQDKELKALRAEIIRLTNQD